MSKIDLFSKEWCSLVFQHRNQRYGAYLLRAEAGKRYRRSLLILLCALFLFVGIPIGVKLYFLHTLAQKAKDFEKEIPEIKKLEARKNHEAKLVSMGRARPKQSTVKGATDHVDEIIETVKDEIVFGIDGEETINVDETWLNEWEDMDKEHNEDQLDLPIEGVQLAKVDKVEEMPLFPGGIPGMMKWLEENIPYPKTCQKAKVKGSMEVMFLVDEKGLCKNFQITKTLHPDLDKLVLAAMKRMPLWTPGKKGGVPCIVAVTLPLHFEPK